jgi:hypothetical protein
MKEIFLNKLLELNSENEKLKKKINKLEKQASKTENNKPQAL